jgi:alkanesulfonate monooxygenase SsuD/methylene tetrahydromethanopterin reductase-like flavin-dependent oxidoreductase (luciferase family)
VRLAESLGYESVYTTHIAGRESLTVLTAYALATERIRIGSGVAPIYTRTPATMAQTAATIDELSGGRLTLGVGVSHRPVVEFWHGQTIDSPAFRLSGLDPRPELPIYIAALSPLMLRLAGEIADGVILWLCNPLYIRDVVVPRVREGRERAGLARYADAGADSPCIGPIPGTDFAATLRAGAPA